MFAVQAESWQACIFPNKDINETIVVASRHMEKWNNDVIFVGLGRRSLLFSLLVPLQYMALAIAEASTFLTIKSQISVFCGALIQ